MLENSIAAAKSSGARVVLPGNIYNYGPHSFPILREDSLQHPSRKRGSARGDGGSFADAAAHGVRSLIVRAGDFSDLVQAALVFLRAGSTESCPVKREWYPGPIHIGHAWAYVPDLAETIARLVDREAVLALCGGIEFCRPLVAARRRHGASHLPASSDRTEPHKRISMVGYTTYIAVRHAISRNARNALPVHHPNRLDPAASLDRYIQRRARLGARSTLTSCVVQTVRMMPQVAHFEHFAK